MRREVLTTPFECKGDDACESVYETESHRGESSRSAGADGGSHRDVAHLGKVLAHSFAGMQTARKDADTAYIRGRAHCAVDGDYLSVGMIVPNPAFGLDEIESGDGYGKITVDGRGGFEQFPYNGPETVAGDAVGAYAQKHGRSKQKAADFVLHAKRRVIIVKKYFKHGLNYDRVATIVYVKKNGGFKVMSIADIVIIVVVALMALIGLWKGFFKTVISFCGWFVSMLIAVLTARVVAEALLDIDAVGNFVAGAGEGVSLFTLFKRMLPDKLLALKAGATEAEITKALGESVVASLVSPFIGVLRGEMIASSALTVGDGIALGMAGGLFEVIVGFALFIVLRIIMTLLVMFLKSLIDKDKKQGMLSRLGGFAFGAVRGTLYCAVLLLIVGFMTPFSFMQSLTAEIDKGVLARPIATQVYALSGKISSNENYYNKLVLLTGNAELPPTDNKGETESKEEQSVRDFAQKALVNEAVCSARSFSAKRNFSMNTLTGSRPPSTARRRK